MLAAVVRKAFSFVGSLTFWEREMLLNFTS